MSDEYLGKICICRAGIPGKVTARRFRGSRVVWTGETYDGVRWESMEPHPVADSWDEYFERFEE